MMNFRRTRHAMTAGMACTLSVLAVAGCQSPVGAPAAPTQGSGAAQADAYPGTTGNVYSADVASGPAHYVVSPTTLDLAGATASHGGGTAALAIDGSLSSCWSSGNVWNPSLTLAMAVEAELTSLGIKVNPLGTYAIEVSTDGTTWRTALANQRNTSWNVETKKLPDGTRAKWVRLKFANGGRQVMVFEVRPTGGNSGGTTPTTAPSQAPATGTLSATATHTNGSYAAARAIDADTNTEWQSGAVQAPALTLDRGGNGTLTAIDLKINPGIGYAIEVSDDGAAWRTALSSQQNGTWGVERKNMPAGTTARFVRLRFANGGKNVMVFQAAPQGTLVAPTTAPSGEPTAVPTAAPTAVPTIAPTAAPTIVPTTAPISGPTIVVDPSRVLHPARSTVLGTNRNHVTGDFANGQAKLVKMRELRPTWGGGKYLYRIGHGPTDGRNDYSYMTGFHFEQAWNQTRAYPYDDIREGLKDAETMGAEQFHVVNYGTSNPDEAGRYVSYLNKAGDANRAKYPFAQQNVKMFELGNEIPWSMVRGHDQYAPNESVYAQRAKLFAQKMRANSDVPIQIGAVASINSNWMGNGWSGGATTVKNILQIMGDQVDFLTYHGYPSWPLYKAGDLLTLMAQNEWNRQKIENEIKPAIKQYANGRDVWIANTEFFTHLYNDVTRSRGLYGALYAADTVTLAFNQDIRTAVEFCFDHKEMADAAFFINGDANNTTAIFKFQKMLAEHWGDSVVATSGSQLPTVPVAGASTSLTLPKLAYTAATSGSKVYVMVTHRLNDADVKANVSVGFTPSRITAHTLTDAGGWNAANATVSTSNVASLDGYTFKKASVTIFEIER